MIRWLVFVGGGHIFFRPSTELACCFSAAWSDFPNLGRDFPVSKSWISVFSRHIVSDPRARVTRPAGAGRWQCRQSKRKKAACETEKPSAVLEKRFSVPLSDIAKRCTRLERALYACATLAMSFDETETNGLRWAIGCCVPLRLPFAWCNGQAKRGRPFPKTHRKLIL